MKKSLFIFLTLLFASIGAKADLTADWKVFMPFDQWPKTVIETPGRVYFMSRTFEHSSGIPNRDVESHSLFYYDKTGDEIISVNEKANAFGNAVACIAYNSVRKYLMVVYTDCNIDFLYDNGGVMNLPALMITSIPGKKVANSITFDSENKRAYIATSFGYICINDDRHEVAESRNYGVDIQSIARCGDNIVLCHDNQVYYAPLSEHRFNFDEYTLLEGSENQNTILPLADGKFLGVMAGAAGSVNLYVPDGHSFIKETKFDEPLMYNIQEVHNGFRMGGNVRVYSVNKNGDVDYFSRPNEYWKMPATSYSGVEVWVLEGRKGLCSYSRANGNVTLTRDFMRPNAPATYNATSLLYHPTFGMLCGSNGADIALSNFGQKTPANISALKGGFWKEYGAPYSGNSSFANLQNYFGLAQDPNNPNIIYRGSVTGGLMRVNLEKPSEILVMANPKNESAGKEGFIQVADNLAAWSILCRFTTPLFTSDGTMWSLYNNADSNRGELWYWPAADRLATTSAANYRPMKKLELPSKFEASNFDVMITLQKNKNMVVVGGMNNGGSLMIYDHKGTPETTNDDRYVFMDRPYDQDGGSVSFLGVNNLVEDPATGLVWVMSQRGLFTVNPATVFENPNQVNRIKVARNDGTNLADYLLNEVNVNHMSIDGEGRKWFSTSNGLVCTSQDGRAILGEFTTENSYLPSNNIFATCYNPENNSIMVATEGGLVEMYPSGSGGASATSDSFRAYPNPVEPDYYGWVRIDNIADGSLVKITDSRGGIVKELGPAQGGSVEWDVSGLNNTRVSTGVYYIMVSPGANGDGNTQIQKILVLN